MTTTTPRPPEGEASERVVGWKARVRQDAIHWFVTDRFATQEALIEHLHRERPKGRVSFIRITRRKRVSVDGGSVKFAHGAGRDWVYLPHKHPFKDGESVRVTRLRGRQ